MRSAPYLSQMPLKYCDFRKTGGTLHALKGKYSHYFKNNRSGN